MPCYAYMVLFYQPESENSEVRCLVLRRQKSPVWFAQAPMKGRPMKKFLEDENNFIKNYDGYTYYLPTGISYEKCFHGKYPGRLCFPGGQANGDESIESCAKREFLEETGVDVCEYDCSLYLEMQSWKDEALKYGALFIQLTPVDFQLVKQRILLNFDAHKQYRDSIIQMAASSEDFTPTTPLLTDDEFTNEPAHTASSDRYGSDWEMTLSDALLYFDAFKADGMDWFLQFVEELRDRLPISQKEVN